MTEAQMWERINKNGPTPEGKAELGPCWLWTGIHTAKGYGLFWANKRQNRAHRFVYELLRKSVPQGNTLDHLCRNPICVNPEHLEIVTKLENTLRGEGPTAINAKKKYCIHGHPFDEKNTGDLLPKWKATTIL